MTVPRSGREERVIDGCDVGVRSRTSSCDTRNGGIVVVLAKRLSAAQQRAP